MRILPLLILPLTVLAACSDSSSSRRSNFGSTLDEAQEVPVPVSGTRVQVTITNNAPDMGTFQTPLWFGFHDGSFDIYDSGSPADTFFPTTNALERLAEDGTVDNILEAFTTQGFGSSQEIGAGMLGPVSGPIAPGETISVIFEVDPMAASSRYFSYASMVIPSNDAFTANGDPMAHEIFDAGGAFVAADFSVAGSETLDAGTEVNDELPANTAFFGQATPDTGVDEGGNVGPHPGFMALGNGGILDDPMFANADFTAPGYELLSFQFETLPASSAATGVASAVLTNGGSMVDFTVVASGLSGRVTGAHFHTAIAGAAGPIALSLTDTIVSNGNGELLIEGSLATPAGFARDLRAGEIYVNLHTALNPAGEIRGQVAIAETFFGPVDTLQETTPPVAGMDVRVTIRNEAPELGTFHTPVWIGFHDGNFQTHDIGSAADAFFPNTNALERIAEDGATSDLNDAFSTMAFGTTQSTLPGQLGPVPGPIAPGETVSGRFRLDPSASTSGYLSYVTMIIPSNDAFSAAATPVNIPIYDLSGTFVASDFTVAGADALDAGTEVNDEIPANTAFFGQMAPDTGVDENGLVGAHAGFLAPGMGGILDDPMFSAADFTQMGYEFLSFRFSESAPGDPAEGLIVARLDDTGTNVDFEVHVRGLSGPATAMHFHEGAAGVSGPVVIDLTDSIGTNANGRLTASGSEAAAADFISSLRNGNIYLNVHTSLNPSGEVRGQVKLAR